MYVEGAKAVGRQLVSVLEAQKYVKAALMQEMTYVKQLEDYENAVMEKRLEEMPETERERLLQEIEQEKGKQHIK